MRYHEEAAAEAAHFAAAALARAAWREGHPPKQCELLGDNEREAQRVLLTNLLADSVVFPHSLLLARLKGKIIRVRPIRTALLDPGRQ
ncbi:MAG TPA: hypothetical protein VKE98_21055 [Gemmataceae bacterium]|nr:hypothetical protein [Gemmataceae bacterium]